MQPIFEAVAAERRRQDEKWGEQNHPNGTGDEEYQAIARRARAVCDAAFKAGVGTWCHILQEEIAEAFAESDPKKLREELVQCAAVIVAWIQKIDRDTAKVQAGYADDRIAATDFAVLKEARAAGTQPGLQIPAGQVQPLGASSFGEEIPDFGCDAIHKGVRCEKADGHKGAHICPDCGIEFSEAER